MTPPPLHCGWQAGSDDVPCGWPTGHDRPHRVRSPYLDCRWIDYVTPPGVDRAVEVARDKRWARELDHPNLYRWGRLAYARQDGEVLIRTGDDGHPVGLVYGCSVLEGENRVGVPRVRLDDPPSNGAAEVGPQRTVVAPFGSPREADVGVGTTAMAEAVAHRQARMRVEPPRPVVEVHQTTAERLSDRRADQAAVDAAAAARVAAALAPRPARTLTTSREELDLALGARAGAVLEGPAARYLAVDLAQAAARAAGVLPGEDVTAVRLAIEGVLAARGVIRDPSWPAGGAAGVAAPGSSA